MNLIVVLPSVVAVSAMIAGLFVPRVVRPSVAVWVSTTSVVLATVATVTMLVQIAASGLSEIPVVSDALGWCRVLYAGQHGATPIVGVGATLVLAMVIVRIAAYVRRVRVAAREFTGITGLQVIESDRPLAFAVPGNPGGVVISRSMLEGLDRTERAVVLAHENAHLRHHHHVFVHVARACAAALPPLLPFARRIAYLTERWADESAAERIGSRTVVATTIARVATLPIAVLPVGASALAGGDVVGRFEALEAPLPIPGRLAKAAVTAVLTVASCAATIQVHHLVDFLLHGR